MLKRFDGTGREPWPHQLAALQWLQDNWDKSNVFALSLPTGTGKQAIARSLQLEYGGAYITPSNLLIDQATATYPTVNVLKGIAHYECKEIPGISCQDRRELGEHTCTGCRYTQARNQAMARRPTFYNPLSYYYLTQAANFKRPSLIVVDEAHKLAGMLRACGSEQFSSRVYDLPSKTDAVSVMDWLAALSDRMRSATKDKSVKDPKARMVMIRQKKVERILELLKSEGANYVLHRKPHLDGEALVIDPIYPPNMFLRELGAEKVVYMSATLLRSDVEELTKSPYLYFDQDSPIPAANREVLYRPSTVPFNANTDPQHVADWITANLRPGLNTMIHVTYGWATKLKPLLPNLRFNTPENKLEVLADFKANGGVWVASGCSEGIDLPFDQCRLNLIPILHRPNLGDPVVKKRRAIDGDRWYDMETLKITIQQIGRSTRGMDDASTSIVGDPLFSGLVSRRVREIPKSFLSSIRWGR